MSTPKKPATKPAGENHHTAATAQSHPLAPHPLTQWLDQAGEDEETFARRLCIKVAHLHAILNQREIPQMGLLRRIIAETDGGVGFEDFFPPDTNPGEQIIDLLARRAGGGEDELDIDTLKQILSFIFTDLPETAGLSPGPEALAIAAEASAHTHAALAPLTTRQGRSRLFQALRPAIEDIVQTNLASPDHQGPDQVDGLTARAVYYYQQYQQVAWRSRTHNDQ